jgi:LysM repeat protein
MSMRFPALAFLCCALSLAAPRPGLAADPQKKPEDFRGIAWGAPASSVPGLAPVERDGEIVHMERPDEKKELGGIALDHVTYSFYKKQFYHAEIGYVGEQAATALQQSLEAKYGPPDAVREKTDPSGHPYTVATWNWPGFAFIGNRHDKDGKNGRVFYYYAPLTDASAKDQGIAPKTAAAPASSPAGTGYAVKKGDSLTRIAKKLGVAEADLVAANPGLTDKTLKAGATLNLPAGARAATAPASPAASPAPPATGSPDKAAGPAASGDYIEYTVKDGDILSKVANSHGARTRDVVRANPDINPDALKPGSILKIPVERPEVVEPPAGQ